MIDTHCHLTYTPLFDQLDDVLQGAEEAGVDRMITVGTTPEDAVKAVGLADRYDHVFATAGLHPHYAEQYQNRDQLVESLRALARHHRVVAVGEMGLDRHYPDPPIELQRNAFQWQLELVHELDNQGVAKPIIIHNREATDETLEVLRDSGIPGERFVFHCFTGKADELEKILAFGAMVSFTGIVTFKNARDLGELTKTVPDDRIMVETDSPYLTPEPHRKVRPNQPKFVPHVAAFIAEQRGVTPDEMKQLSDQNAERFFGLSNL